MICFDRITKSFGNRKILDSLSFDVKRDELFYILGKSGTGKSVTLKHLIGILTPDSGNIFIGDRESRSEPYFDLPNDLKDKKNELRKFCGMIFQQPALIDGLDVFDNIAFGLRGSEKSPEQIQKTVHKSLNDVGLDLNILKKMPDELSYGMKKRVSIARTLAPNPCILCFDEPTTGLDIESTRHISNLIRTLTSELKKTCVVVSHDITEALRTADRILLLDLGKPAFYGTPKDFTKLKNNSVSIINEFLKEVLE